MLNDDQEALELIPEKARQYLMPMPEKDKPVINLMRKLLLVKTPMALNIQDKNGGVSEM